MSYCLPVLGNSFAADAVDTEQVGFFGGREDDKVGQADVGRTLPKAHCSVAACSARQVSSFCCNCCSRSVWG